MLSKSPVKYVAKTESSIIGFAAGREGWIDAIAVTKEMRGKGVGGFLLNKIEEYHRTKNLTRIRLHVKGDNTKAVSFYSKNDYLVHGVVFTLKKTSILMHKKLR